ncbi:hypothetical protein SAMN05428969_3432 [Devosia sp. YR412]|uniref:tetratricopeptide repeat protein n=1 Tax=Devosia sp. YR412 TaxID=1881030 RepID=UPI0008BBB5CF|nr:SEL1-like repeat protein [Devosia sp. YR412]SEQ53810.1 hypothetical protein SAMN05428969_3432 [Devosia sp. YR412]
MLTNRLSIKTALLLAGLSLALPAVAADPAALCDQLAASPVDAARPDSVPGVPFGDIVVADAETACRAAWAADNQQPRMAYQLARVLNQDGRTEEAMALYQAAVDGGYVEAGVGLGQTITDIAYAKAVALNQQAAEAGSFNAMFNLGVFARDDDDDGAAAIARFEQAAALGDAEAAYNIGVLYDEGELVVRDAQQAARYYEQAIAGDFSWAKINLGYLLLEGTVDDAERARALELFRSAAIDDADINAGLQLGLMLQDGSAAEQDESETLVIAALRDRDMELARWLQQEATGLSERNLAAIKTEIAATGDGMDADALARLRAYYAR